MRTSHPVYWVVLGVASWLADGCTTSIDALSQRDAVATDVTSSAGGNVRPDTEGPGGAGGTGGTAGYSEVMDAPLRDSSVDAPGILGGAFGGVGSGGSSALGGASGCGGAMVADDGGAAGLGGAAGNGETAGTSTPAHGGTAGSSVATSGAGGAQSGGVSGSGGAGMADASADVVQCLVNNGVTGWGIPGQPLICESSCVGCHAACMYVGTRSEGWYVVCEVDAGATSGGCSSSAPNLIRYTSCQ